MTQKTRKKSSKKKSSASPSRKGQSRFPPRWFLYALIFILAAWVGLFAYATGEWLPDIPTNKDIHKPGWNQAKQDQLEELQIQKMLNVQGSDVDEPAPGLD